MNPQPLERHIRFVLGWILAESYGAMLLSLNSNYAPYLALPSVQNANQPETPLRFWNSDWLYPIFVPPRGFEPRS